MPMSSPLPQIPRALAATAQGRHPIACSQESRMRVTRWHFLIQDPKSDNLLLKKYWHSDRFSDEAIEILLGEDIMSQLSRDDQAFLSLGREVSRMIGHLKATAGTEPGYSRRHITFPGGDVFLFTVNTSELADRLEVFIADKYKIQDAQVRS